MTKEDKQIIDRAIKENWRTGDRTRLKRLLEKNLKLYRENVELEKENEEMKKGLGCETCQIHLEYMGLNDKINKLEKENRLLGERCNQLLKDKGDLTDRIDDIKANCDLAIEGRDIKIIELKDHLAEEVELHLRAEEYNKSLEEENNKLLDVISNYEVKVADLEQKNHLLGERCNQLLKDKGNLTDELQELKETFAQTIENDEVAYETLKLHDEEEIGMLKSENVELNNKLEKVLEMCCGNGLCAYRSDIGVKQILEEIEK